MAEVEICPCCGQKIVEYKHNLNKVLASGLYKLYKNGACKLKELELTYSEFEILVLFLKNQGRVFTRNQLISKIKK